MTDRVGAYIVVMEEDRREDDVEATLTALRMTRGVLTVEPVKADYDTHIATARVTASLGTAVAEAIRDVFARFNP